MSVLEYPTDIHMRDHRLSAFVRRPMKSTWTISIVVFFQEPLLQQATDSTGTRTVHAAVGEACRGISVNEHGNGVGPACPDITGHVDVNGLEGIEATHRMEATPLRCHQPTIDPHPNAVIVVFLMVHAPRVSVSGFPAALAGTSNCVRLVPTRYARR